MSPSSRRAWIEISKMLAAMILAFVALLAEGVDRNISAAMTIDREIRSPSSRRAWIEIETVIAAETAMKRRPPRGGRG